MTTTLYAALVKAQKAFGPALKTHSNPAFKSRYADLSACVEAVLDALNDHGFYLAHKHHECESGVAVEAILLHESGEMLSSGILRVPASKQDAQGYGSALTYARRYSLMAVCGIAPEDDDGNAASRPAAKPAGRDLTPPTTPLSDTETSNYLLNIEQAQSMDALKDAFRIAMGAAKLANSQHHMTLFKSASDARKEALQVAA